MNIGDIISLPPWLAIIFVLLFALPYGYTQWKRGTYKATEENNLELSNLVHTLQTKIQVLEELDREKQRQHEQNSQQIAELRGKVMILSDQLSQKDQLIFDALVHWFDNNPDKAVDLGKDAMKILASRTSTNTTTITSN